MSTTPARRKVRALLALAGGKSQRAAAAEAGVSPATVSTWRKDPVFAGELVGLKAVVERKPVDAQAVMDALSAAEARLAPPGPRPAADGSFAVTVSVPAAASPRERERLVARAVARGIAAAARGRP